jgi:opacity protein-like surface antigen
MKILSRSFVCTVLLISVFAAASAAQEVDMKGKWGLGCNFHYSWPSFSQFNNYFEDVDNLYYDYYQTDEHKEFTFEELSGIGGDIRYGIASNIVIGVALKRMVREQNIIYTGWRTTETTPTQFIRTEDWMFRAVPLQLNLYYYSAFGPVQYFVGGGGSYYSCHAEVIAETRDSEGTLLELNPVENVYHLGKSYWDGSCIGFQGKAGAEYFIGSNLALGIEGCYSYARAEELTDFNEQPFAFFDVDEDAGVGFLIDDEPVEFDLSGFDVSAGVRLYF